MSENSFEEFKMNDDTLMHHGTLGMQWGVHNDETKRKYGEIPGKRESKKLNSDSDLSESRKNNDRKTASSPSLAERAVAKIKQNRQAKKDAEAAEKQRVIDEENAKKQKEADDAEFQSKYGMTKDKYDALRKATLDSHDPRVIAKGMHLLTDEELRNKINRLEAEGKIKSAAAKARKEAAEAKTAELNYKKQTLPYRLGEQAARTITNAIVNDITKNTLGPIRSSMSKALGQSGAKAFESLKKQASAQTPKVKEAAKNTAATVKQESEVIKANRETNDRKKQTSKSSRRRSTTTHDQVNAAFGEKLYNRMKNTTKPKNNTPTPSPVTDKEK